MEWVVVIGLLVIIYVYSGYLWLLRLVAQIKGVGPMSEWSTDHRPSIDVIIAAHNERDTIEKRIANILACDYPPNALRVIVASDRSTDGTDDVVRAMTSANVLLVRSETGIGKSEAQNEALAYAESDIVLFTDAESVFEKDLLQQIAAPFSDPAVGVVGGCMIFLSDDESGVERAQGYYWKYELAVRGLESRLGILAKASGSCLAARRSIVNRLPSDVGEDCIVPLDAVIAGYKVIHADRAMAYDRLDSTVKSEFRSRVRMTLRNWVGTWRHGELLNPLKHPGYAFALWSHKILRWLSPFFILAVTAGVFWLAFSSRFWAAMAVLVSLFYLAGVLGWISERYGFRLPLVRTVFSFLLANAGFLVGVVLALARKRVVAYR